MEKPPAPESDPSLPTRRSVLLALLPVGGLVLCAFYCTSQSWTGERAPFPYVWRDVAVVQLLSALPLAWLLAVWIHPRVSAAGATVLALFLFAMSLLPLTTDTSSLNTTGWPVPGSISRAALALGLVLSATLLFFTAHQGGSAQRRFPVAASGIALVGLLVPPALYLSARCQHDVGRLGDYLEQSRFGEARALARSLLLLEAPAWKGRSLREVTRELERIVQSLEARVAIPLAFSPSASERLERARELAMLGRTEAALVVLSSASGPEVGNLRGTIHETRSEWATALQAYQSARAGWEAHSPSSVRASGLLQATTGVAYCQRKLGDYAAAEKTYQQVLALSPTADSHFLLAQFYEDAQEAEKARFHARRAMALASDRYQREGKKLIHKLSVFHFSCLGVYSAERNRNETSLGSGWNGAQP